MDSSASYDRTDGLRLQLADAGGECAVSLRFPLCARLTLASPVGGQIVFTVWDSHGWGHIRIVDTATGTVRELKADRTDAVFLTSRYIWYQGERACTAAEQCGSHPPYHPLNGKTYIYDLQTGTETESVITSVSDVWPHPA